MGQMYPEGTAEVLVAAVEHRHPGVTSIMKFFAWEHLPANLQQISMPFGLLALDMVATLQDSAELVAGLRKLLEAKDCMVRAALP